MTYKPGEKAAKTRSGLRVEPRSDVKYGVLIPEWVGEIEGKIGRWDPNDGAFRWFDDGSDKAQGVPDRYARTSFGVMVASSAYVGKQKHDLDLIGPWREAD